MTDTATDLPQLLADTPAHAEDDALGFQPHADRLAAMLLKQQFPDASFVVGIEGEWGEGKSTFINCLKQRFAAPKQDQGEILPDVVEFNPWWFENPEKTASNLLEAIINGRDQHDKEAIKALEDLLAALNHITPWMEKLASNPLVLTALFGANALFTTKNAAWLGALVAAGLSLILFIGTKWLSRQRVWSESLAGLKDKAAVALSSKKMKVQKQIVIIDDLDRLSHEEIREVFRVMKGVLDLPNIVYVIAYDRAIVASALDEVHKGKGEAYLEKIIQYPYMLPKPHAAQYHQYVIEVLVKALNVSPSEFFQQSASRIIDAFFPVPRSVKRLSAALFNLNDASKLYIDMDSLDYLFLESVRYYDRDLFSELTSALLSAASFPDAYHKEDVEVWVAERFAISANRYGKNRKIVNSINYFTGIQIAAGGKPDFYSFQARGLFGILLSFTTPVEDKQKLAKFVRAYLAKHRDQDEASRYEVDALVIVKNKDAFSDYVRNVDIIKVKDLFWAVEHYQNDWRDRVDMLIFSRAWIGFIRDGLLSGEDAICGISFSNLFGLYLRIFGGLMEHRVEEGGDGTVLLDIFNDFFDIGSDDIFWSVIFFVSGWAGRDYMLSRSIISRDMILDGALDEKDMSVLLSVGIFRNVFLEIKANRPDAVEAWLASLECTVLSNQKSIIKLSEFIMYVELEVKEVEALRKNYSFVTLLRKYQQQLVEMFEHPEHHARYARLIAET